METLFDTHCLVILKNSLPLSSPADDKPWLVKIGSEPPFQRMTTKASKPLNPFHWHPKYNEGCRRAVVEPKQCLSVKQKQSVDNYSQND